MPRTKLSLERKKEILTDRLSRGFRLAEIAREFNVSDKTMTGWVKRTDLWEWYQESKVKHKGARYPLCPYCGSPSTKNKQIITQDFTIRQQFQCTNPQCGKYFTVDLDSLQNDFR